MSHRLYVAGPSEFAGRAHFIGRAVAAELGDAEVVSTWHAAPAEKYSAAVEDRARQLAINLAAIDRATVVVVLCDVGTPRSTFGEAGYALGRGLPVIWVLGTFPRQRCIFDAHPAVIVVEGDRAPLLARRVAEAIRQIKREAA